MRVKNQQKSAVSDPPITLGKIDRKRERHKEKETSRLKEKQKRDRQTDRQTDKFNGLLFLQSTGDSNKKRGRGTSGSRTSWTFRLLWGSCPHPGQTQSCHSNCQRTPQMCQTGQSQVHIYQVFVRFFVRILPVFNQIFTKRFNRAFHMKLYWLNLFYT